MSRIPENLIDAAARAKEHPTRFEIPNDDVIAAVGPGDFLKIGLVDDAGRGERFWMKVSRKEVDDAGPVFVGSVDNNLVSFPDFPCGSEIACRPRHVMDVLPGR